MTSPPAAPSFLVVNVSRIGDTLLATPALRAIAQAYPRSRITCLGHPKRYQVLQHIPFVHDIGPVSKNRVWWRGWGRRKKWDYAIVYGFDQALVRYALRVARRVVAFTQEDANLNARLYRHVARPASDSMHAAAIHLLLPELLGIKSADRRLIYHVAPEEAEFARTLLHDRAGAKQPMIGLLLESFPTKAYRDWPVDSFIALARRLRTEFRNAHFVVLGGNLPAAKQVALRNELASDVTILAGELTLRQSAAVMEKLDLYIGVDTGPTHIAGALNVPMVALYHCLHPSTCYAPLDRDNLAIIDHPAVGTTACGTESRMAAIDVETVYRCAAALLRARTLIAQEAVA